LDWFVIMYNPMFLLNIKIGLIIGFITWYIIISMVTFDYIWITYKNTKLHSIITSRKLLFVNQSFELHDICNYVSIGIF
jgi:hypothetical protein